MTLSHEIELVLGDFSTDQRVGELRLILVNLKPAVQKLEALIENHDLLMVLLCQMGKTTKPELEELQEAILTLRK